jgi:polyhydroxybutyrate depolymerase
MALAGLLLTAWQQNPVDASTAEGADPAASAHVAPTTASPSIAGVPWTPPALAPTAPGSATGSGTGTMTADETGVAGEPEASRSDATPVAGGEQRRHGVSLDGWARTWTTFEPATVAPLHPLVIVLHGRGGSGRTMELLGLDTVAAARGVEVAYPDAVDGSWNDGRRGVQSVAALEPVDDIRFLETVIEDAVARDGVDPARIAIVGHSNGALMASAFACQRADLLRAIVLVSGAGADSLPATCQPSRPLSVLEVHGDRDRVVPFDGGAIASADGQARGSAASVPAVLEIWRRRANCPAAVKEQPTGSPPSILEHASCPEGTEVALQLVVGGGHGWRLAPGFDTGTTVWGFLVKHGISRV